MTEEIYCIGTHNDKKSHPDPGVIGGRISDNKKRIAGQVACNVIYYSGMKVRKRGK